MILNPNESGKFWNFLCFVHKNVKSEYKLKLSEEKTFQCRYFTSFESDNELELDDSNYEEYWIIFFKNMHSDYIHEINYHNISLEVWCDGKKVDLNKLESII